MVAKSHDHARLSEQTAALEHFVTAFDVPLAALIEVAQRMAERRIESSTGLSMEEATALLETRGLDRVAQLVRECGQTWSSEEVAAQLGITRQAVHERKQQGRLLAFTLPSNRGDRYPCWQFRGRTTRSWVPKVIVKLGNGFDSLQFLLVKRKSLDGHCYRDLALSGDEDVTAKMLAAARRLGGD